MYAEDELLLFLGRVRTKASLPMTWCPPGSFQRAQIIPCSCSVLRQSSQLWHLQDHSVRAASSSSRATRVAAFDSLTLSRLATQTECLRPADCPDESAVPQPVPCTVSQEARLTGNLHGGSTSASAQRSEARQEILGLGGWG